MIRRCNTFGESSSWANEGVGYRSWSGCTDRKRTMSDSWFRSMARSSWGRLLRDNHRSTWR